MFIVITQWLLAHAAVSKSVIQFLVLVLFRTYLTHVSGGGGGGGGGGGTRNRKCKSWEVEVIVMFVAMRMWGKNIADAATMTATVVSHSAKYAIGHITT